VITNDILRRLCYALQLNDATVLQLLASGPQQSAPTPADLAAWFLKDDEAGFRPMPGGQLLTFLDGLILLCRGPRDEAAGTEAPASDTSKSGGIKSASNPAADNNLVLKKIRIALSLQEQDLLDIMQLAGISVSKNELSALFRKPGQRNYVECMDQFLRNFLAGLNRYRQAGKLRGWPPAGLTRGGATTASDS